MIYLNDQPLLFSSLSFPFPSIASYFPHSLLLILFFLNKERERHISTVPVALMCVSDAVMGWCVFFFIPVVSLWSRLSRRCPLVPLYLLCHRWQHERNDNVVTMIDSVISKIALIYMLTDVINECDTRTNVFPMTPTIIKSRDKRPARGICSLSSKTVQLKVQVCKILSYEMQDMQLSWLNGL